MEKSKIMKYFNLGATGEYSHMLICFNSYDLTDELVYVRNWENVYSVIDSNNDQKRMRRVMEIYNYNLDLESQINETRANHIDPLPEQYYLNEAIDINNISADISENLKHAIEYAAEMHKGQTRLTGEPYINHPLRVAGYLLKYKESKNLENLLISAILHDTVEDTSATYCDIVYKFGPQVASLVGELTTNEDMKKAIGKKSTYLSIKIKNMSSWARTIKLCDRLDNVKSLLFCDDESFKDKYVNETIIILDYLMENAASELSQTQVIIIKQLIALLFCLCKNKKDMYEKLKRLGTEYFKLNCSLPIKKDVLPNIIPPTGPCKRRTLSPTKL